MATHVTPPASPAIDERPLASIEGAAPESTNHEGSRGMRVAWVVLAATAVVAVSVFWAFDALPFMDLPAHAGLIAMRHRFAESAFEQRFYVLAPHIGPYSLFRFLGELFVRIIGPIGAVRMLATLPVVATPLALLFARRRLFADTSPTFGFLGLVLSFGLMTLLGFASYLLGLAVMLVGLTLWLELLVAADDRAPEARRREIVTAIFAPLMFVGHGHAFLLFLLCAFVSCLVAGRRLARLLRLRALVPALALAGWVAWLERGATTPEGSVPVVPPLVPIFQSAGEKFSLLVTPTLMTRTGIDFAIGVVVWVFTIACTLQTIRALRGTGATKETRHTRALHASAAAVGILFLALPHAVGWFGFVDGRLVPLVLFLALLGLRRSALGRPLTLGLDLGAPIGAATITTLALVASYRFQDEARGYREILARVPVESRLLNLPLDPNSDVFTAHPFIHYDKLVLAERPTLVSDVWFHQGSALYPTPANPALRLPASYSESDLKVIDWPAYRLMDWDYVLIRTRPNGTQPYAPEPLMLEEHRGGWWLFRHASASQRPEG
jgi:hypothetical protein